MEQNYGGPVWHASAAMDPRYAFYEVVDREGILCATAGAALAGVGDPAAGEWREWTGRAYHLRRRLTADEAALVGPVVDVRGTPEGDRRLGLIAPYVPPGAWGILKQEAVRP
jgi:hypothetical protein